MLLHSASDGQDLNDSIFQIVDQINHGVPSKIPPDMKINIAEFNFNASSRAMELHDYKMAYSYLKNAHSLLPKKHWRTNYDLSLRIFLLQAKAAYTCGKVKKAEDSLKTILKMGRSLKDKLDAYYLYVTVSTDCFPSVATKHWFYTSQFNQYY